MANIKEVLESTFTIEKVTLDLIKIFENEVDSPDEEGLIKFVDSLDDLSKDVTYEAYCLGNNEFKSVSLNFHNSVKKIRLMKLTLANYDYQDIMAYIDLQFDEHDDFDLFLRVEYQLQEGEFNIVTFGLMYDWYKIE